MTGVRERLDDLQPPLRRWSARVELAREIAVEHCDRYVHAHQVPRRHRSEQVEIALDEHALGGDRDRVLAFSEHFDDLARDLPFALDRLVRIGVGAERNRLAAVAGPRKLPAQKERRIRLGEQPRLEVQSRRQIEVRVARPGIAIHAAVFTALVRIDRSLERDVGRVVARNDGPRVLDRDDCLQRCRLVALVERRRAPAIIDRLARITTEAVAGIERGAATLDDLRRRCCHSYLP